MADPTPEMIAMAREMVNFLRNFPVNGQVSTDTHGNVASDAVLAGMIERVEITKRCEGCGAARHDHSYFRLTMAGRYLLAAAHLKEQSNAE